MKGPDARPWRRPEESAVIRAEERDMTTDDLIEKSRKQAENFARTHEELITAFISAGFREQITQANDPMKFGRYIARNEPHYVPDTIDDLDHQGAFLVALAQELQKPEYNQ